jgi:hypothetical protein
MTDPAAYGWYRVLDGAIVESGGDLWRIVLQGAQMIDERQWLQLLLVGEPTLTMVLRLPWTADEDEVLSILSDWLAQTDDHTESVVSVGRIELPEGTGDDASPAKSSQVH